MAIEAICLGDKNAKDLIIGLSREDIELLLRGDKLKFRVEIELDLVADDNIVLIFDETNEDLVKHFPLRFSPSDASSPPH